MFRNQKAAGIPAAFCHNNNHLVRQLVESNRWTR
jgi:hypothetical protein